jgi:hypothetical protein
MAIKVQGTVIVDDSRNITNILSASVTGAVNAGSATFTTDLAVEHGGTGRSTFTTGAVLLGNGTGGINVVSPGTSGNVLVSNGTSWTSEIGGINIVDDASTDTTQYLGMSRNTTGSWTQSYISSTKLYFNPSTGKLSSTEFRSLSDIRYKENIVNVNDAMEILSKINGVSFNWKETGEKSYGVIAQEIEKVLPDLIDGDETKTVNYNGLIAFLIESIKELNKRVEELESK